MLVFQHSAPPETGERVRRCRVAGVTYVVGRHARRRGGWGASSTSSLAVSNEQACPGAHPTPTPQPPVVGVSRPPAVRTRVLPSSPVPCPAKPRRPELDSKIFALANRTRMGKQFTLYSSNSTVGPIAMYGQSNSLVYSQVSTASTRENLVILVKVSVFPVTKVKRSNGTILVAFLLDYLFCGSRPHRSEKEQESDRPPGIDQRARRRRFVLMRATTRRPWPNW